ncbi:phosphoethanolamine transferase [Oceanibaculum pacificum]|uniref:Sulfatase n=1 Tax=Oceanibaculum pacificum TaxID=580166 RepID=A0A154WFT8_9PROT|nr:phosphoethanolamine--lipid A transferase [Oceanibaculum pacificum]KZD12387.1 hypothetical protein AUP43_16590 [Oceanibaculum pacificum]
MRPKLPFSAPSRPSLHPLALVLLFTIFLLAVHNHRLWQEIGQVWIGRSLHDLLFLGSLGLFFLVLLSLPLQLVAFPRLLKPVLAGLVLIAAGISYFMDGYGVLVEKTMIVNIVETDMREAGDLLSWPLAWHMLLTGVLPAALILSVRLTRQGWKREALLRAGALAGSLAAVGLIAIFFFQDYASLVRNNRQIRHMINPVTALYSATAYALGTDRHAPAGPPAPIARLVSLGDGWQAPDRKPLLFVFVLGETARAANFSLNGYARMTNPELANLPVVSFTEVASCSTSTAESVPCIFSPLGRPDYSPARAKASENLLDLVQKAGLDVVWLENNSGCKGVCARVPTETLAIRQEADNAYCDAEGCMDMLLVERLRGIAASLERDTVVVLHQMGSHGPAYFRRYTEAFRRFTPTCDTSQFQDCETKAITNSYDNSILYTDHVLAEAIRVLNNVSDRIDTALLYVSDHGESLGEGGTFLHGLPYAIAPEVQKHVPMIWWNSGGFQQRTRLAQGCLAASRDRPLSHDTIFHTVLGLLDIETDAYKRPLDALAECRLPDTFIAQQAGIAPQAGTPR